MMNEFGGHGWGMGWWWIIVLIILLAVIWIIVKGMNKNSTTSRESTKTALDLLNERYAKGEIDQKEYKKRKKDLKENL